MEKIPEQEKGPLVELTPEMKKNLGNAWSEMVVETKIPVPENIGDFTEEELKKWLFDSVMEDVGDFVEENNIRVDESIARELSETTDNSKRAETELAYIKEIQKNMADFSNEFRSRNENTYWNSFPSIMKETKSYNCVGGTLVGLHFLEKAKIKSFYGNPVGHAVNIIELSDGRLVYADFTNQIIREIKPEKTEIEGVPALKINDPSIEYGVVSIHDPKEIVAPVMENFYSMQNSNSLETIKTAREFVDRHSGNYNNVDFGDISEKLFPKREPVRKSKEMKKDEERIDINNKLRKSLEEYIKQFSPEDKKMLSFELKENKEKIRTLILDENSSVPTDLSSKASGYLEVLVNIIKEEKSKSPENYEYVKSYFISLLNI